MNSSFDQAKNEEQYDEKKESFYDDETMDNFLGCISKSDDIIVNPEWLNVMGYCYCYIN